MTVKSYFNVFRTMAIDRLSHVSQERESTISQFLQNVAVRPKLWHTTVQPHLDWVRFGPSETSFNMAAAAETKWRWDLHMVNCLWKYMKSYKKRITPPPLEAILVIFGRRALNFFLFKSSWKKMKNDATLVRMRSGDHLGDAKMSKTGTSLRRI